MKPRLLDASVLIASWRKLATKQPAADMASAAKELIRMYSSGVIVSPVYIEFVCWFNDTRELERGRTFLSEFDVLNGWDICADDLQVAKQIALRIPPGRKPRQFGDCLIAAMARRLKRQVFSLDKGFPR